MPEDKELEKKEGESKEDYIVRLKKRLHEIFDEHIHANRKQAQFASEIAGSPAKRERWESRQLAQWNARHNILKRLVIAGDRDRETITLDEVVRDSINPPKSFEAWYLELRQRWLTAEGKSFFKAILIEIKKTCMFRHGDSEIEDVDFTTIKSGEYSYRDFYYVSEFGRWDFRDLRGVSIEGEVLANTNLSGIDFSGASIRNSELYGVYLCGSHLEETSLENTRFACADLRGLDFTRTNMREADLAEAKLQDCIFYRTDIRGTDFAGAILSGPDREQTVEEPAERSENEPTIFEDVRYAHRWRGSVPLAFIISFVTFLVMWMPSLIVTILRRKRTVLWPRLYWEKDHDRDGRVPHDLHIKWPRRVLNSLRGIGWAGRPTLFQRVDASSLTFHTNPILKRYIEDEHYIEGFKVAHPILYLFWAELSDCGRSFLLWGFWSLFVACTFTAVYTAFPGLIEITSTLKAFHGLPERLIINLYFSIVTFTTLGFGDIHAATPVGAVVVGIHVILGYIFLGGLVAIMSSKLARRA